MNRLIITFKHGGQNTYDLWELYRIERTQEHFIIWDSKQTMRPIVFCNGFIEKIKIEEEK